MIFKTNQLPRLSTATKERILLDGTILLLVKIGDLRVPVWSRIVETLAVDKLLGTSFNDRKICAIFPCDRKVLPWQPSPEPILPRSNSATLHLQISVQRCTEIPAAVIGVLRHTVGPQHSQICIPINLSVSGLFQPEKNSLGSKFPMLHVAPDVMKPTETEVFLFLIADFSAKPYCLLKRMMLKSGMKQPSFIVIVDDNKVNPKTLPEWTDSTKAAVRYTLKKNERTKCSNMKRSNRHNRMKQASVEKRRVVCRIIILSTDKNSSKGSNHTQTRATGT